MKSIQYDHKFYIWLDRDGHIRESYKLPTDPGLGSLVCHQRAYKILMGQLLRLDNGVNSGNPYGV